MVSVELSCNVGFNNGIFWNKHGACSKADHLELFAKNEKVDVIFIVCSLENLFFFKYLPRCNLAAFYTSLNVIYGCTAVLYKEFPLFLECLIINESELISKNYSVLYLSLELKFVTSDCRHIVICFYRVPVNENLVI